MTKNEKKIKEALEKRGLTVLEIKRDNGMEFTIINPNLEKNNCKGIISKNRFPSRYREGEYRISLIGGDDYPSLSTTFAINELITYINEDITYLNH